MSQYKHQPIKRRWVYLIGLMFGAWAITAATLVSFWPIQPRLTLGTRGDLSVAAISADGETLVTFTVRALQSKDDSDGTVNFWSHCSGPLKIWNVRTGTNRTVCLPGQSCSDEYVVCYDDDRSRMQELSGWSTRRHGSTFNGRWLLFDMDQQQFIQGRYLTADRQVLINVDTGETRVFGPRSKAIVRLSPTGKWYSEMSRGEFHGIATSIKTFETATGNLQFSVEGKIPDHTVSFSADDLYFACADYGPGPDVGRTRIWNVATGEIVWTIDQELSVLTFAKVRHQIAGVVGISRDRHPPRQVDVCVWDIDSRTVVNRMKCDWRNWTLDAGGGNLEFLDDDQWLIGAGMYNAFEGGPVVYASLNLRFAWNLKTNETVIHSRKYGDDDCDPNVSENCILPASLPRLFWKNCVSETEPNQTFDPHQLFDIKTGLSAFTETEDGARILLTSDARRLVIQKDLESGFGNSFVALRAIGFYVPNFLSLLVPEAQSRWVIIDIPTGRRIASIPSQESIHWLSRNEKTLVTVANDGTGTIHVWDFPFRPRLIELFVWSLLFPAIIAIWSWLRYLRRLRSNDGMEN